MTKIWNAKMAEEHSNFYTDIYFNIEKFSEFLDAEREKERFGNLSTPWDDF
ncbi:MAG: hypothetical protein LLG05_16550 [Porphyromonadaceae bacterium]|nr:hypothetical protein [Porphyromonadaceae bacterium]